MYALPKNDDVSAFAIEDTDTEAWRFHHMISSLSVTRALRRLTGVSSYPPPSIVRTMRCGCLRRANSSPLPRELRVAVPLPLPVKGMVPFNVTLIGTRYISPGEATVWYYERNDEQWVPVLNPASSPHAATARGGVVQ